MKAIISSTYDNNYIFNIPLAAYCWNKLGVDVVCFMPYLQTTEENEKIDLVNDTLRNIGVKPIFRGFASPKHKEATYAQLTRVMAWGVTDIGEDEVVYLSDCDMLNFQIPPHSNEHDFTVLGHDLTPPSQYPVCYVGAKKRVWEKFFRKGSETYQQALDRHLGHIECEGFRGNYWSYEQEQIFNTLQNANCLLIPRSNGQNQFAQNRCDRDDAYWIDRVTPSLIDAHLWRPPYTEENTEKIIRLLEIMYPLDSFHWVREYAAEFRSILNQA